MAETYDVLVTPTDNKAYTIAAESIDRTGFALGTLAPRPDMRGEKPAHRSRTLLTMADMGMDHGGTDHGQMDHGEMDHTGHDTKSTKDHEEDTDMDHSKHADMDHSQHNMQGMNHAAMGHTMPKGDEDAYKTGVKGSGWAQAGTPKDARALSYRDLRLLGEQKDVRLPERTCLLYTSPSPRDRQKSRMPSSA